MTCTDFADFSELTWGLDSFQVLSRSFKLPVTCQGHAKVPVHVLTQKRPSAAQRAGSGGSHLLGRNTTVPPDRSAACSEQWRAPPQPPNCIKHDPTAHGIEW